MSSHKDLNPIGYRVGDLHPNHEKEQHDTARSGQSTIPTGTDTGGPQAMVRPSGRRRHRVRDGTAEDSTTEQHDDLPST